MSSIQKGKMKVKIPTWMTWLYGMMSVWLIPWILYLQATQPQQRFSISWRATWVLFDLALLAVSVTATYFLRKKSLWASLILAFLAALLAADMWFDIMTSPIAPDKMVAIVMDVCLELPLAVISLLCARYILRQAVDIRV